MKKIVINTCKGDYSLKLEALEIVASIKGDKLYHYIGEHRQQPHFTLCSNLGEARAKLPAGFYIHQTNEYSGDIKYIDEDTECVDYQDTLSRDDPALVAVVYEYGDYCNTSISKLRILEIPDQMEWTIKERDGREQLIYKTIRGNIINIGW